MRRKYILITAAAAVLITAGPVLTEANADTADIAWEPCGDKPGAECGSLTVPIDRSDPDGGGLDLQVTRRAATDPDKRIGVLFFNPGGPGTGAADYVRDYAEATFSPVLRERFDLIGIDPRGVAGSQQVRCDKPVHDPEVRQFPRDADEYERLREHNRAVADSCEPLAGHMDTTEVARDLDAVRAALGEDTISYFGKSYGSILGTTYAELFPERVRAMSLDGVVDHATDSEQLVVEGAAAVEASFEHFVDWCADTADCALHDRDVAKVWDDTVAAAEAEPIPVPDGRALTAEELRFAGYALLNLAPELSGKLAEALAHAESGDGSDFAAVRAEALDNPDTGSAYRAVMCMDFDSGIDDYDRLDALAKRAKVAAPHMDGTSEFWGITAGCQGWQPPATHPQHPIDIDEAPPVLLVGNTGDPATPVDWAHSLSKHIDESRVLTYDGSGHTAYLRSGCATKAVDAYLTDKNLPEQGAVCTD